MIKRKGKRPQENKEKARIWVLVIFFLGYSFTLQDD
jgi:hypothetical protein